MVHGCLSKNGRIPFDEPELRATVREAVDRDVRAELHNWVWFNKQTVEYGGVLWTGNIVPECIDTQVVTGTMSLLGGELVFAVARDAGEHEWRVSSARLGGE
jgi:hypothetical protein